MPFPYPPAYSEMETPPVSPATGDHLTASPAPSAEDDFWWSLAQLLRHRTFIIAVTALAVVASIAISLLLPVSYAASTRVLIPSGGGISDLLGGSLPSSARALLGGRVGSYTRSLALLTSETMYDRAVQTFDLVDVYDVGDSRTPEADARAELRENASFAVDDEFEFLSVTVLDRDPQRAADLANFMTAQINELNADLTTQSAGGFRSYIEQRYDTAMQALDSTLDASRDFQSEFGVFALPEQTQGFFTQLAAIRAELIQLEIQYESLESQLGDANPQVTRLRTLTQAAQRRYGQALRGGEETLPVSREAIPAVARQYAELERERVMQATIIETLLPLLEQARMEEMRRVETVQVVDAARPPDKKAEPRRSRIVILSTLSAALLACLAVLARAWYDRSYAFFSGRVSGAAGRRA